MNIIDHRILIPAAPEVIWKYLSDIRNNPRWQVNCKEITLLTSAQTSPAPGLRWRATSPNGRQYVAEITAWYERLGYEYTFVDGTGYKRNKGQIRLQEIAEGTVVQWTFQYELGGLLGGLRNSLSRRRAVENEMIDSLRALYKVITKLSEAMPESYSSRSLMRDAPDVAERSQYKPRHPSVFDREKEQKAALAGEPQPDLIDEPPVADDDTRPRPATTETSTVDDHERFARPPEFRAVAPEPAPDAPFTPPAADEPAAPSSPTAEPDGAPPVADLTHSPATDDASVLQPVTHLPTPDIEEPDTSKLDTAKVSVFDLFGVPKPSETQEMRAIASVMPEAITPPMPAAASALNHSGGARVGLRARLRRQIVPLRRNT